LVCWYLTRYMFFCSFSEEDVEGYVSWSNSEGKGIDDGDESECKEDRSRNTTNTANQHRNFYQMKSRLILEKMVHQRIVSHASTCFSMLLNYPQGWTSPTWTRLPFLFLFFALMRGVWGLNFRFRILILFHGRPFHWRWL
jgi:hypothetical protein